MYIIVSRPKSPEGVSAKRPLIGSAQPYEHEDEASAMTEASRLAAMNPERLFYIMKATAEYEARIDIQAKAL